jgi:hypothetical protein
MIRVAARELVTVVERVLIRAGYSPGLAVAGAEFLTAGEVERPVYARVLDELLPELEGVSAPGPPLIQTRGGTTDVDARGALALVVGPTVVDLLELGAASSEAVLVVVSGAVGGALLGPVTPAARERGLVVTVETEDDGATCTLTGRCVPGPSAPGLASHVELPRSVWESLVDRANRVLAPATAESRLDAGY